MSGKEYWRQRYEVFFAQLEKPLFNYFVSKGQISRRISITHERRGGKTDQDTETYNANLQTLQNSIKDFRYQEKPMDIDEIDFIYFIFKTNLGPILKKFNSPDDRTRAMLILLKRETFNSIDAAEEIELKPTFIGKLGAETASHAGLDDEHLTPCVDKESWVTRVVRKLFPPGLEIF